MSDQEKILSCTDCGIPNCYRKKGNYPQFCLTTNTNIDEFEEAKELYKSDEFVSKFAYAAAEVEGMYYGKLTRVEEIIMFAKKIGAQKIGIATCGALINEAKIFAKILQAKGLKNFTVSCKVGSTDKTEVGVPESLKVEKGCHESLCNPVMQAKLLNKENTDLNVIVGLCVGHDSIFIKYSEAPVTTLITKDKVLVHNPAAALYASAHYYKKLLEEDDVLE